jgi:hypothetical protein
LGENFTTKTALENRIREIRDRYSDGEILSHDDFDFMLEVLKGHPQFDAKCGAGIRNIFVNTNPEYTNTRCFWLTRTDGSSTDFSFKECLTPTLQIKKFHNALRAAIEPFTMQFKRDHFDKYPESSCPITGERLDFVGSHVDHIFPQTFQELVEQFIKSNNIDVEKVEIIGDREDNNFKDKLVDEILREKWIEFHNTHATLQIVSRTANLSYLKVNRP